MLTETVTPTKPCEDCPKCGSELQATEVRETYFTFRDGKWEPVDDFGPVLVEIRYYCADGCELEQEDDNLPQLSDL